MTRLTHILAAVTIASSLAACSDAISLTPSIDQFSLTPQTETLIAYGRPDRLGPTAADELERLRTRFAELRGSVYEILESEAPLEERDRRIRALVGANKGFGLSHYVEQFAAIHMLRRLMASEGRERDEAVAHYAMILVQNGSPEAPLLYRAIDRIAYRWPRDKVAKIAMLSAERALGWTEQVCRHCGTSKALRAVPDYADRRLDTKVRQMIKAAQLLTAMASP